MSDEEKQKNLQKLENGLWDFFYSALDEYYKKGSKTALEISSSTTPTRLVDDLKNLWLAEVKLMGWGVTRPEFYQLENSYYQALLVKRGDEKRNLVQHAGHYERFWFKEKNFEVLIEAFDKYVEENAYKRIDDVLYKIFGPEKKPSENEVKTMSDRIKEGNKKFIKDLKEIRAELKKVMDYEEQERKKRERTNRFWNVVCAIIGSVVGGFVVWWLGFLFQWCQSC